MFGRVARDEAATAYAIETGLPSGFDFLDKTLSGDVFAIGNALSFADIALIPHMFFFENFLSAFDLRPLAGRKNITTWWQAQKDTNLVQNCHARIQTSLDAVMANMK